MNWGMVKSGLLAVVGSLGFCLPLAAQQTGSLAQTENVSLYLSQPAIFKTVDSSTLVHGLPMLSLLDGRWLPISTAMGRMGMAQLDVFPNASLPVAPKAKKTSAYARNRTDGKDFGTDGADGKDALGAITSSSRSNPLYYSGEIGFLYGHSTGKYGGDVKQGYFIGEVGDDNVQITVGGSYEDSNFQFPRRRR